jgi:hypothetical protein
MADRRIEHTFPCSENVFWERLFLDDVFNRECYLGALGFERWEVVHSEERDGLVYRTIDAVPPMGHLPAPLKKLLATGNGYQETGIYDPKRRVYRVTAKPQSLADKLTIRGELTTVTTADGQCRRTYVATVEARLFGVGSVFERAVLDGTEKAYERSTAFSRQWLVKHSLTSLT